MADPKTPQRITAAFAFSYIDRAIQEGTARRDFGPRERKVVFEFFGRVECVFCGSSEVKRWDHLVAVKNGGDTILGNMVPACSTCDDSKQDRPFEQWMLGSAPKSPQSRGVADLNSRIKRIKDYVSRFAYTPASLESRFTEKRAAEFSELMERARILHLDIERFLAGFAADSKLPNPALQTDERRATVTADEDDSRAARS